MNKRERKIKRLWKLIKLKLLEINAIIEEEKKSLDKDKDFLKNIKNKKKINRQWNKKQIQKKWLF